MTGTLVIAEARGGVVREITAELVGAAAQCEGPITVLLVSSSPEELLPALAFDGVTEVLVARSPADHFEPHVMQVAAQAAIEDGGPRFVVFGHTIDSLGVGPALAAARGYQLATDVTQVQCDDRRLVARRSIYGGKLEAETVFEDTGPTVLMLRPGTFVPAGLSGSVAPARALDIDLSGAAKTEHLGFSHPAADGVDITGADLVVAIGRGIEDGAEVERFERLAARMGGELGVSRPLVDVGWAPSSRQVGQSGQTVTPKVYLALGISGAVQHLAGIRNAETVIAVNTDPRAPIFDVADFGVVADLFEVAEALERHFA